jgi:hypothetical protein
VRMKYKKVNNRLYPRYSTFEVNPPNDNFEVQYSNECRKIYNDDAPAVKNALHHLLLIPLQKYIPMIILRTEGEVSQQYRYRRARNNLRSANSQKQKRKSGQYGMDTRDEGRYHDEVTHEQKPKHIVRLMKPNTIHNKIQFHKNSTEW